MLRLEKTEGIRACVIIGCEGETCLSRFVYLFICLEGWWEELWCDNFDFDMLVFASKSKTSMSNKILICVSVNQYSIS